MNETIKLCLRVTLPSKIAEEISWELVDLGASAVETRDDTTLISPEAQRVELIAGFDEAQKRLEALEKLSAALCDEAEVEIVDEIDDGWKTRWREFFKPVILEKLQVITPWMEPPSNDKFTIVIDPGQAFGTGGHATTQLILEMLERRAMGEGLPDEILDLGCGSGILAVASAKLGAKKITAVDIDPESVAATLENASVNGVAEFIEATRGGPESLGRRWPLVLANLQLAVFQELAPKIARLIAPGGEILLSGLLSEQVDTCVGLWPDLKLTETRSRDEWAAVALTRAP